MDNLKCKGFINNEFPVNSNYQNLRIECGKKLAGKAGEIYIKCDLLSKEVQMIKQELGMLRTYDADKDRKLRIMPKVNIKDIIGLSPDWLDTFIMRMWFETHTKKGMSIIELSQFLL
ncbi:MAG: hypothetical protein ABR927_13380 [Bacteroidales bacterium]